MMRWVVIVAKAVGRVVRMVRGSDSVWCCFWKGIFVRGAFVVVRCCDERGFWKKGKVM